MWVVPVIENPLATLHIIGGYNDDFSGRQPFALITELTTIYGRDGAILQFTKKSSLKELVVSGLLFDAAASNKYDQRSNSILKGQSRSYPLLSFSMLKTSHLVVADNIFMNGGTRRLRPLHPAAFGQHRG